MPSDDATAIEPTRHMPPLMPFVSADDVLRLMFMMTFVDADDIYCLRRCRHDDADMRCAMATFISRTPPPRRMTYERHAERHDSAASAITDER